MAFDPNLPSTLVTTESNDEEQSSFDPNLPSVLVKGTSEVDSIKQPVAIEKESTFDPNQPSTLVKEESADPSTGDICQRCWR